MHDPRRPEAHQPAARLSAVRDGASDRAGSRDFDLVTRDVAARDGIEVALVEIATPGGGAEVLSAQGPSSRPVPAANEFVSRAVRSERAMIEAFDVACDGSLGNPASGQPLTFAISSPLRASGGRSGALCVGLSGAAPPSDEDVVWVLTCYARLVSAWTAERRPAALPATKPEATGCLAYTALVQKLHREIDRCERLDLELACCFVAIERTVEQRPERVLPAVARALLTVIGSDGSFGRYGREQFVAMFPGAGSVEAEVRAGQIRAAVRDIREVPGLDAWVGVGLWKRGTGLDFLFGDADIALSAAIRKRPPHGRTARMPPPA